MWVWVRRGLKWKPIGLKWKPIGVRWLKRGCVKFIWLFSIGVGDLTLLVLEKVKGLEIK